MQGAWRIVLSVGWRAEGATAREFPGSRYTEKIGGKRGQGKRGNDNGSDARNEESGDRSQKSGEIHGSRIARKEREGKNTVRTVDARDKSMITTDELHCLPSSFIRFIPAIRGSDNVVEHCCLPRFHSRGRTLSPPHRLVDRREQGCVSGRVLSDLPDHDAAGLFQR